MPATTERDVQNEHLFRAAFDHAAIGMVMADAQGRVIRANDAFARLTGRSIEELVGRDSSSYTHPDDRDLSRLQVERVELAQTEVARFEKRYIRDDGRIVWALIHLSNAFNQDGTKYLIATAEDITEQKRTREELTETRRRLSSALIAGEVATYEWDVLSDRLWGDENFDQIFGTERDADGTAPLARFVEAIHPDDRQRVMDAVNAAVESDAEYDIEYRIQNGSLERWVSARGRIERHGEDGIMRFHGVVLDITARKRAEQELQRRTHLYNSFLSSTDDLAYLIDRQGRFTFANRALLDLWGLPANAGKTPPNFEYPTWSMDELAQVFAAKKTITGEVPYVSPTGATRIFEYVFSPVLDENGEVELIAGTSRDVTERRKAAEVQQQLTDQLQLALEAAHMGWWQFDLDAGRVYWDERARAIFGAQREQHGYEDVLAQLMPEDAERIKVAVGAATNPHDPQPYDVEYRVRMSDGSIRWVASKGLAIFEGEDGEKRAVTMVGTAMDVTQAKAAQEALHAILEAERAARSEAERASRMKDEFLATLSHELRTPLAAILGWAQILGSGGSTDQEINEGIAVIARNARAQAQIIEDLLEMSRIISGKIRLEVQELKLLDVVHASIDTVRAAANAKGVSIEVDASDRDLSISGDANRLQQVFWNLLSNAVKFTPGNGHIHVRAALKSSFVEVAVSDTGEGIRPEFLPYVFDRFRQADASTTRRHGGLGLGLAIVKQLVELHGGVVSVASEGAGKGTTFTVRLPLMARKPAAVTAQRTHRLRAKNLSDYCEKLGGLRALVVDDESDARGVVRRFLEDCEVVVTTASSAAEALALLQANAFDVLISDIGMPNEDGYALIRKVRDTGNAIPAIALTAYARPEDRGRAVGAGYQTHVAKPADPAELVAIVAGLVGRA